ncbi:MAG: hypothetical protein ACFBSD_00675 [Paracoccaceae bacterium]
MTTEYAAIVLLERPWQADPAELSRVLTERFPALGVIRPAGDADRTDDALHPMIEIDGAPVLIEQTATRLDFDETLRPFRLYRDWDHEAALFTHRVQLRVSAGGDGHGLLWAKAYATAVTLVAGALAKLLPARAVFYPASDIFLSPDAALMAGRTALKGVSPIEAWAGIIPFTPENAPDRYRGAMTVGLRGFLGRELELAPVPVPPRHVLDRIRGAVWQALDGETPLADRGTIRGPAIDGVESEGLLLRGASEWLRPGVPAWVLIAPDAAIDANTLHLKPRGSLETDDASPGEDLGPLDAAAALLLKAKDQATPHLETLAGALKRRAAPGTAAIAERLARRADRLGPAFAEAGHGMRAGLDALRTRALPAARRAADGAGPAFARLVERGRHRLGGAVDRMIPGGASPKASDTPPSADPQPPAKPPRRHADQT